MHCFELEYMKKEEKKNLGDEILTYFENMMMMVVM